MRLKTYWHVLTQSLTSTSYYLELIKGRFGFSLRFFVISIIVLGLSTAARINHRQLPMINGQLMKSLKQLETNYPPDLELIWTGHQLEISPPQELAVPYPVATNQLLPELPSNLSYLVPEPKSIDEISYSSLLVLTPDQLFVNDLRHNWTQADLKLFLPEERIVINQATLPQRLAQTETWLDQAFKQLKQANYVVSPLVLLILRSWVGLLHGVLIFLLLRLNQIKLEFRKSIQLSLHIIVMAEVVFQLSAWLYPQLTLPMFSLAFWLILVYILLSQRKGWSQLSTPKSMSTGGKG